MLAILQRMEAHVFAAERLHSDDTTVPVLAKGKTDTGRCWVYVRVDRPFGGTAPPAAMFYDSRDRSAEHPQAHLANYAGIFQADAYSGYNKPRGAGPDRDRAEVWGHRVLIDNGIDAAVLAHILALVGRA